MGTTNVAGVSSLRVPRSSQDMYVLHQQNSIAGELSTSVDIDSLPRTSTASRGGYEEGYISASLSLVPDGSGTQGGEGGEISESFQSTAYNLGDWASHDSHTTATLSLLNEPGRSGVDMRNLEADTFDFQRRDHGNRFELGMGDFDRGPSREPVCDDHEQECAELINLTYTFDYSFLPAEVLARAADHAFPPSHLQALTTSSRAARFPPAYPFDMPLPRDMSYPVQEMGLSGVPGGMPAPATPLPSTIDPAQLSGPMGNFKHPRAEEEDSPDAPRLSKKRKDARGESRATLPRRAAARRSRAPKPVAAARATSPVAGASNLGRAAENLEAASEDESDSDEDTDTHDNDHAHDGTGATEKCAKRDRRTKVQVASVTRTDLPKVPCPVKGCETMFDPLTHDANREHLKRHYAPGALDGKASLPCLWMECKTGKAGTRKAGTRMITHVHKDHVGRAYICPVPNCKRKWASSCSGDLPQHLARCHKGWRPP